MARRIFIEPNIFLNPSLRVMPTLYKTLWLYLLTSCDEVGVWVVDWEMAGLACGGKIDPDEAARLFLTTEDLSAKPKAIPIHGGRRWFIRSYLDFQYSKGILNNSQWAKSLQKMLEKHGIDFETLEPISNPLPNPSSNPLPKGIGQDRIGQDKDMEVVSTALSYQGGAGGNGKIPPDFIDSIYTDFVAAYGKTKNAVQQFKIQQELLAAVIDCMDRKGVSYNEAGKFLIWCADLANQADTKNRNAYRLAPQNWLAQRCYHSNPLENIVEVAEKETPTQKLARQMAEFQKQHQQKKAQEAGNNGK